MRNQTYPRPHQASRGIRACCYPVALLGWGGLILGLLLLQGVAGCSRHSSTLGPPEPSGASPEMAAPDTISLDSPAPRGISPELWTKLTCALREALKQRGKAVSGVPLAQETRVADFVIVADTGGVAQASWSFRFSADYNRNGRAGADDLVPIAMYYGAVSTDSNWAQAKAADGNRDNRVDLADITPLGMHFNEEVSGFEVQTAVAPEETAAWSALQQVAYNPHTLRDDGAVQFQATVPAAQAGRYYRCVPYLAPPADATSYGLVSNAQRYYGGTAGAGAWPMLGHDARGTYRGATNGPAELGLSWIYQAYNYSHSRDYNSPVLGQDGAIYSALYDLKAIQPDGTLRWDTEGMYEDQFFFPVVGSDGSLYCPGTVSNTGVLEALRPDGTRLWSAQLSSQKYSPVLLASGLLYVHTSTALVCFDLQGVMQWTYGSLQPSSDAPAPLVQTTSGLIVFTHVQEVYAVTPSGTLAWEKPLPYTSKARPVALSDGSVAVPHNGGISAYSSSGDALWSAEDFACVSNAACASDDSLRFIARTLVAPYSYTLRALSPLGIELWNQPLPTATSNANLILDSSDRIYTYMTTDAPHVICYGNDSSLLWQTDIAPVENHNTGSLCLGADGALYLWCGQGLLAFRDGGFGKPDPPVPSASLGGYFDHVRIQWPAVAHTDSYRMYRDGAALPMAEVTDTQYDDFSVPDGGLYTYTVSGVNILGEGMQSAPVQGRITVPPSLEQAPGDWAMLGRDAQHTYRSAIIGPSAGVLKWSYTPTSPDSLYSSLFNSPVFGQAGTAYLVQGGGILVALDPGGTEVWRIKLGDLASTPAIGADGTVYCAAQQSRVIDNAEVFEFTRVYAVSPSRTVKWVYQSAGTTRFNRLDTGVTLDGSGNLHCLLATGELATLSPAGDLLHQGQLDRYLSWSATPAIGPEGNSYLFSITSGSLHSSLFAFDSTGAALWEVATSTGMPGYMTGPPSITPDGRVYAPGLDLSWFALDGTRTLLDAYNMFSNLALSADGRIFLSNRATSGLSWADSTGAIQTFASAPTGDLSGLMLDAAGKVYYVTRDSSGQNENQVYCFSSAGALLWSQPVGELNVFPGLALRDDGALFVTTYNSLLVFADP